MIRFSCTQAAEQPDAACCWLTFETTSDSGVQVVDAIGTFATDAAAAADADAASGW